MDKLYRYTGSELNVDKKFTNCKLVAHAGLFTDGVVQNTIPAYIKAVENGFDWLEIDVRNTSDNVYVMSHNDTVTLYDGGESKSVTISSSLFDDICGLSWDSSGDYMLCTLESVFRELRLYEVGFILDRKAGTNTDLVEIAARCGVLDKIILSYGSFIAAYNDRELLNKYPYVKLRIYPNDYQNAPQYLENVKNPTFADTNVVGLNNYTFTTPLAYNIPFIFSGCELSSKEKWAVLASGCMFGSNITYDNMMDILNIDYDIPAKITISNSSESISVSQKITISAESNVNTLGGCVYGFTVNPLVAACKQMTFGQSASFEVEGKTRGTTILRVFTGSGAKKDISIIVS